MCRVCCQPASSDPRGVHFRSTAIIRRIAFASGSASAIGQRTRLDLDDTDHAGGHTGLTLEDSIRDAEQQLREASREAVARLRDEEVIGDAAFRRVISDLDLDEVRNIDEPIV